MGQDNTASKIDEPSEDHRSRKPRKEATRGQPKAIQETGINREMCTARQRLVLTRDYY